MTVCLRKCEEKLEEIKQTFPATKLLEETLREKSDLQDELYSSGMCDYDKEDRIMDSLGFLEKCLYNLERGIEEKLSAYKEYAEYNLILSQIREAEEQMERLKPTRQRTWAEMVAGK